MALVLIEGDWDPVAWYGEVRVGGKVLDPHRSQRVVNHSPDGFSWGYSGSGPSQLALAILLECGVPQAVAVACYQDFKQQYVARVADQQRMRMLVDVDAWVRTWTAMARAEQVVRAALAGEED